MMIEEMYRIVFLCISASLIQILSDLLKPIKSVKTALSSNRLYCWASSVYHMKNYQSKSSLCIGRWEGHQKVLMGIMFLNFFWTVRLLTKEKRYQTSGLFEELPTKHCIIYHASCFLKGGINHAVCWPKEEEEEGEEECSPVVRK